MMDEITKWIVPIITLVVGAVIAIATMRVNWRLQRGSRLHEKQFEAISLFYSDLWLAHHCLKRSASTTLLEGEDRALLRQEAEKRFNNSARFFYTNEILLPEDVCVNIERLLGGLRDAQLGLTFAMDTPVKNGYERKARWDLVQKVVFTDLPPILNDLKAHSRKLLRT